MKIFFVWVFFFFSVPVFAMWVDEDFYYKEGSRYTLDSVQTSAASVAAKNVAAAALWADAVLNDNFSSSSPRKFPLPYVNEFGNEYGIYSTTATDSIASHRAVKGGPLTFYALSSTGTDTAYNETTQYGLTNLNTVGVSCFESWRITSTKVCIEEPVAPGFVASLPAENIVGSLYHEQYIECGGEAWLYSADWRMCYVSASAPISASAEKVLPLGYASPAEYSELGEIRSLLSTVISSISAGGLSSRGMDITNITNSYQYITSGFPVVSSGTSSGSGDTGSTSGSSISVNIQFPDYGVTTEGADSEWSAFSSSSPDSPILRQYVDFAVEQSSAAMKPVFDFMGKFLAGFDTTGYDVCHTSACFSVLGSELGCTVVDEQPEYETVINFLKWFVKISAGLAALFILLL